MSRVRHTLVIGAGVGGLTAAAALHRHGRPVTVLERAPGIEPLGSGLVLTPNALRALDTLDLGDAVRSLNSWTADGGLRSPSGRWLARTDGAALAERFGGPFVALHRATLIDLLRSRLPEDVIRTGAEAELVDPGGPDRPAQVRAAGEELTCELVIAADGIHSPARRVLFPGHPEPTYAGFTAWRVMVPEVEGGDVPHETWGRGQLWGTQPLHDGRVYAYGAAAVPAGGRAPDDELAELLRRFGDWHQPVPAILEAATPGDVLRSDIYRVGTALPAYHRGRVALVGDAAHAMAPTLGQGGNQAIEDAVVLAHHLAAYSGAGAGAEPEAGGASSAASASASPSGAGAAGPAEVTVEGGDFQAALDAYTRDRLPRTMDIVRRADRMARLVTRTSAPACTLRNAAIAAAGRIAPKIALRVLDGVADWSPPTSTG